MQDRGDRPWPSQASETGLGRVAAGEEFAVPVQHRLGMYQQPEPTKCGDGQSVHQCGEQCPVIGRKPQPRFAQLVFQNGDLMAQRQGLRIPVPIS